MSVVPNKRSNIALYVSKTDINSHRIRIIAAEKSVPADIIEIDAKPMPPEFLRINPSGVLPILADREDLVITEPSIIAEYLDERFPHPPLLPVYPIARAKARLMMLRIEREWYALVKIIETSTVQSDVKAAKKSLAGSLIGFTPVFSALPYFLSEEFSLLDCCVAPLLWRLSALGISIPPQAAPIQAYMKRIFDRPSFVESLNVHEYDYETV